MRQNIVYIIPDNYTNPDLEKELTQLILKPEMVGRGANQFVYRRPSEPSKAIKLDVTWLKRLLDSGPSTTQFRRLTIDRMVQFVRNDRRQNAEFAYYLKDRHIEIPKQNIFIGILDIPKSTALRLGASKSNVLDMQAVPVVYKEVEYKKELADLDPKAALPQIKTGYAELPGKKNTPIVVKDWIEANENWVTLSNLDHHFDRELLDRIQVYGTIGQILDLCKRDKHIAEITKTFVDKAITYSEETGRIVDILGHQNALFLNGKLLLHDAIYHESFPVLKNAAEYLKLVQPSPQNIFSWYRQKIPHEFYVINDLANSLNYVRCINALAQGLGMKRRLETLKTDTPIDWQAVLLTVQEHWESLYQGYLPYSIPVSGMRRFRGSRYNDGYGTVYSDSIIPKTELWTGRWASAHLRDFDLQNHN